MRLLVIEDERDLCEDIAKKLRLSGYEADTCVDGERRSSCWRWSATIWCCSTLTCPRWTV